MPLSSAGLSSLGVRLTVRRATRPTLRQGNKLKPWLERVFLTCIIMANLRAIDSFIQSLARWLKNSYDLARSADAGGGGHAFLPSFDFKAVSSSELSRAELDSSGDIGIDRVSIYLFRASIDQHLRSAGRTHWPDMRPVPLSLQLHLLFSLWSENPGNDHIVLAWLMRQLHLHPVLDAAALNTDGGWQSDEVVHLIPAELSNEDMMRLWDALTPSYRLSVSYIARIVRIDPDEFTDGSPVVATRLRFGEWKEVEAT